MTPRRYGPLQYVPITRRTKLTWPGGARVALWVNPNIEFFGLDDVMPGNLNERMLREHAKIPNVRNWAVRDYGNRIGIWRIMEVLTRYGIRASAALNSEVCDHHPEIIEEAGRLGWLPDALINTRTAPVEQDLRPSLEPVIVRSHPAPCCSSSALAMPVSRKRRNVSIVGWIMIIPSCLGWRRSARPAQL